MNSPTLERGLHFVVVDRTSVVVGRPRFWPHLYFILPGVDCPILCQGLLDHFAESEEMGYTWMRETCLAVGLLVDFAQVVLKRISLIQSPSDQYLEVAILKGFAIALRDGTLPPQGEGLDVTGLYWIRKGKERARTLASRVDGHIRWLGGIEPKSRWFSALTLKDRTAAVVSNFRKTAELAIRASKSILAHLRTKSGGSRKPVRRGQGKQVRPAFAFPRNYISPFLENGFVDFSGDVDYSALVVAALIFTCGLRSSEPFHLYTSDVQFTPEGEPQVFLFHPQDSEIEYEGALISRETYLGELGRLPRNVDFGTFHAGWKGMEGDDLGALAYQLPNQKLRTFFEYVLRLYIFEIRPEIMAARPRHLRDHPYLLVSSGRNARMAGVEVGDPYTLEAFRYSWESAVKRLSKLLGAPALVHRWELGTTPHGGRHYYGRELVAFGFDAEFRQACMHHKHPDSQAVYTMPSPLEVNAALNATVGNSTDKETSSRPRPHNDLLLDPKNIGPGRRLHRAA